MMRSRIQIRGIVQGVGFRPFVYHLALDCGVTGYVLNTSDGVLIEAQGSRGAVESFIARLPAEAPRFAQIERLDTAEIEPTAETGFLIRESLGEAGKLGLVLPDIATCPECLGDLADPDNRRFGYPFTNCTNCGPRYTIIQDLPYDRPHTTMRVFAMCAECHAEYDDPGNRRFHAQPNACPRCGPRVTLVETKDHHRDTENSEGHRDSSVLPLSSLCLRGDPGPQSAMQEARELLRQGRIVAIKGLGGFQLACDATNDDAVRALRSRKKRSDKPFALMARDLAAIERFCLVSAADRAALLSPARPIVILPRRPDAPISLEVAPGNRTLGVMLPYTPLHHLLFGDSQQPGPYFLALVMTSGNLSEEPIVTANGEAWERLGCVADWFLFHNRDIYMRVDDSVVRTFEDKEFTLRRARGYVPRPIDLGIPLQQVLACGAELKNTFCLTKEHYAIVSQHIGDLENYETLVFFRETLENMKKLFRVEPRIAAYDLHPLYLSTRLALEMEGIEKVGVQHHHAHIASCMAENHVSGRVIGVAFDGTGYGTDGKIWGGEFLLADFAGFERAAHLAYVPLAGGDTAIRQPWRSALSHLLAAYPDGRSWSHLWPEVPAKAVALVEAMIRRGVNAVDTSSCGRLFDAVAAIVGLRHEVNFEAQAAMELEAIAEEGVEEAYPFEVILANGKRPAGMPAGAAGRQECLPYEIDVRPMIRAVVEDVQHGAAAGRISARFHNTVAAIIVETCRAIREANGLERVCLSGGTFQNMYLLTRAVAGLRRAGFEVFLHSAVPPNDGGISLGQAVIANTKKS